MNNKRLGKGLEELLGTKFEGEIKFIEIGKIRPSSIQPRSYFSEEGINSLAESIKKTGVIEPILVSNVSHETYEVIAGERRFRAAKLVGLEKIPCIVKNVSLKEKVLISLIENIQREDLNPIDEANFFKRTIDEFKLTQEELADEIGKSRVYVANKIRLLQLPLEVQNLVKEGKLSEGHARALLQLEDENEIVKEAYKAIKNKITVRKLEEKARKKDPNVAEYEKKLSKKFNREVKIKQLRKAGGWISFRYYSNNDLEDFIKSIS
ncbi:MAG: ParB/RepB/Spo0J family partition protein [bacterium]|nr:ParB/RepB/Spo0J family partition protein [bacterium]